MLTPIEKLDRVLEFLEDDTLANSVGRSTLSVIQHFCEYEEFTKFKGDVFDQSRYENEIEGIVQKLEKDNYITSYKKETSRVWSIDPTKEKIYRITFEGRVFIQQGGYSAENESKMAGEQRLRDAERNARAIQITTLILTLFVALGSIVAATYYFLEIWKNASAGQYHTNSTFWQLLALFLLSGAILCVSWLRVNKRSNN
ncbi:MAG: hypothetical protein WCG87_12930 [Bacteroidota bacterium]